MILTIITAKARYYFKRVAFFIAAWLFFSNRRKTIYVNDKLKNISICLGSVAVGAVSGFFGGGGGMLCVPLLEASGLATKRAHATALFVILPICIISAVIYIINGYFDAVSVFCACIGVTAGGSLGAVLLDKLPSAVVGAVFALLMIGVGVKLVIA